MTLEEANYQLLGTSFEIDEVAHLKGEPARYMVLDAGLQWGNAPRDKSGASYETFASTEEAIEALQDRSGVCLFCGAPKDPDKACQYCR